MDEENENLDSSNETEDTEKVNEETVANTESEEGDKPEYTENEKKLYARMKKAEADAKLAKIEVEKAKSQQKPTQTGDIDKLLDAKLEKRDLESLDLSESLKKEVETYAKLQNISVKKALGSEYITFLKEKEERTEKTNNASTGGGRKPQTKKDYSEMKATDFDMTTPEGRAEFAKYREQMKKELG